MGNNCEYSSVRYDVNYAEDYANTLKLLLSRFCSDDEFLLPLFTWSMGSLAKVSPSVGPGKNLSATTVVPSAKVKLTFLELSFPGVSMESGAGNDRSATTVVASGKVKEAFLEFLLSEVKSGGIPCLTAEFVILLASEAIAGGIPGLRVGSYLASLVPRNLRFLTNRF
jgi:hypothetical protein